MASLTTPITVAEHWCFSITSTETPAKKTSSNGIATQFDCPMLKRTFDTDRRAGEIGAVHRPLSFEPLEGSLTLKDFDLVFDQVVASLKLLEIQLLAVGLKRDGTTSTLKVSMDAFLSENPLLGTASAEPEEREYSFVANTLTYEIDTTVVLDYDPANYLYSINGVNQYAGILAALTCDTPII